MRAAKKSKLECLVFLNLMAALILSVLAFGTVEPWSIAIFELNAFLVGVLLALDGAVNRDHEWRGLRISLPLVVLLLLGILQIVPFGPALAGGSPESLSIEQLGPGTLSLDPHATREAVVKLLALIIYFIAALRVMRDSARRRAALLTLTVFGFAVSVFAIVQRLTYTGKMYWIRTITPYAAPYGPYGNYNHFSGMVELIVPLPLAYLLLSRIENEQRLLWAIAVVMMLVAATLSLSRSGTIVLVFQVGLLLILIGKNEGRLPSVDRRNITRILQVVAISLVVIALAFWIGNEVLIKRIGTLGRGSDEYSVTTRIEYWKASFRMFLDHPVLGVGLGAFPAVYPAYGTSSARYERLEQTHNDYLQLLTDAGVIGGLTGVWFLVELAGRIRRIWPHLGRMRSRDGALLIGGVVSIAGILLHSFVDFNLQIAANALLFVFITATAVSAETTSTGKIVSTHETEILHKQ
jgi:O-antigen ligase